MADLKKGIDDVIVLQNSKVKTVFTPHMPIKTIQHFIGRSDQVSRLVECVITPGNHALLYGDRGVGKSSLANAVTNMILKQIYKGKLSSKSCDSTDTFSTIMDHALRELGFDLDLDERTKEVQMHGNVKAGNEKIGFEVGAEKKSTEKFKVKSSTLSPSWVGSKLKGIQCLIVIDEFDAVHDQVERKKMAELLKYLSDNSQSAKVILVGIGKTADDLTAGHPSVRRCLMELHLERMSE